MAKQLVVRHHRPFRRWLLAGSAVLVVIVLVVAAFMFGEYRAGYGRMAAMQLQTRFTALQQDKAQLQEQLVVLQREREVDHAARERVQKDLEARQSKLLALQEEVAFYKGIVSPAKGEEGIHVQSLKFTASGAPGLYHYQMVLVQVRTKEFKVSGDIDMKIHGTQQGSPVIVDASQVASKGSPPLRFAFQYFQDLVGNVVFPDGFAPANVTVTVRERHHDPVRQNFEWQKISG